MCAPCILQPALPVLRVRVPVFIASRIHMSYSPITQPRPAFVDPHCARTHLLYARSAYTTVVTKVLVAYTQGYNMASLHIELLVLTEDAADWFSRMEAAKSIL